MQTIQFETTVDNGAISIPKQYAPLLTDRCIISVVVLKQGVVADVPAEDKPTPKFSALSIDTRNFKFDREEANARR